MEAMKTKTIGLTKEIVAERKKAEKAAKDNAVGQSPDDKKPEE